MRSDTIRRTPASDLEVLLVTSRGKGNRILPKDQVKPGKTAAALVVEELYEEAGARGTIGQALVARCDFPLIEVAKAQQTSKCHLFARGRYDLTDLAGDVSTPAPVVKPSGR
jgi:hypothetical protein